MLTDRYLGCASELVTEHDGGVWSSQSSGTRSARACDNGCVGLPSPPVVPAVHKDELCMNKYRARGAKVRWNVRRDCGVGSKPRLSGGTLSVWTGRLGVSWMETVVTQSGEYRSGGSQHVLS